jgi:tetratricopeptide (TPR) repeat protein/tRNA A-37 threonylcarbamoyl transferase component Bud32
VAGECLGDQQLLELVEGRLDASAQRAMVAHVDACSRCRELLAAAARVASPRSGPAPDDAAGVAPARGATIGRYVIIDQVGAGAMGEVYAAYDSELERKVAIKLLREDVELPGAELRARLAREAKVLAKLSHPNVVPVYDAGAHDGRTFVAMELVTGRSLRDWLDESERGWRATVATFVAAGRGLAAAHAASIVHRDFKPENVLIGDDGQVRVVDFGLAGQVAAAPAPDALPADTVTRTGQVVGTPAYMAPELLEGAPATAASDQFSFAVALYEALYGVRPFRGGTLSALAGAARRGELRPAARKARVPGWVRRTVVRGLQARPEARHPSMAAFLGALDRDPGRWWRRGAPLAVALVAVVAVRTGVSPREPEACRAGPAELAKAWGGERKERVRAALLTAAPASAPHLWATVERQLDDHARDWLAAYQDACEATYARGEQTRELLDRRMACLHAEREQLRALAEGLSASTPAVADRAALAVFELPSPSRCAGEAVLRSGPPPAADPATRARVERLDAELADVDALGRLGQLEPAVQAAERVVAEVADADAAARALVALGRAQQERRQLEPALAAYDRAVSAAVGAGDDRAAAQALLGQIWIIGVFQGHFEAAEEKVRFARPLVERLDDDALLGDLSYREAIFAQYAGRWRESRDLFARALALLQRARGERDPYVAAMMAALGVAERQLGRLAEGRSDIRRALDIEEDVLGPDHPRLGHDVAVLGRTEWEDRADYDEALRLYERARALARRRGATGLDYGLMTVNVGALRGATGHPAEGLDTVQEGLKVVAAAAPGHVEEAYVQAQRGELELELGRYAEAIGDADAALGILDRGHGTDDLRAIVLATRARAAGRLGRADAVDDALRAVALDAKVLPPEHPQQAWAAVALCDVLGQTGRPADALGACARGLFLATSVYPPEHVLLAHALAGIGVADVDLGRREQARGPLVRAEAILSARRGDVALTARARFALARVLWDAGETERARRLASDAGSAYLSLGSADPRDAQAVERWLGSHM